MSLGQFRSGHASTGLALSSGQATRVATAPLERAMEMNGTDHGLADCLPARLPACLPA